MNIIIIPAALAAAISLVACGHLAMAPERVDTIANDTYVAIAVAANSYEASPGADTARAEALKLQAWSALAVERHAYALGKSADLGPLTDLLKQAKALGH